MDRRDALTRFDDASFALAWFYRRWSEEPFAAMRLSENGRRLIQLGLEEDVRWCAQTDSSDWIAVLRHGALEGEQITQGVKPYGEIFQRLRDPDAAPPSRTIR